LIVIISYLGQRFWDSFFMSLLYPSHHFYHST